MLYQLALPLILYVIAALLMCSAAIQASHISKPILSFSCPQHKVELHWKPESWAVLTDQLEDNFRAL